MFTVIVLMETGYFRVLNIVTRVDTRYMYNVRIN